MIIEFWISQEFFPILLTTLKKGIDCNQNANLENLQEYLANFKIDKVDCYKTNEQTDSKSQLY